VPARGRARARAGPGQRPLPAPAASAPQRGGDHLGSAALSRDLAVGLLGRAPKNADMPYPGSFGIVYLAVVVVLCALAVLLLIRRYQKASLL